MGNTINVIKEVHNRLLSAIGAGKPLNGVKRVRIGRVEEARKGNDFPIITIMPLSGVEEPNFPNRHVRDNLRIGIVLVCNKLADQSNSLFNDVGQGAIALSEKIRDVLDKNTSGVVDNTMAGTCEAILQYEYSYSEVDEQVVVEIVITTKTKSVVLGGRSL